MALWATIGVGLGSLVPNQVAAIVIVIAFTQFVEPILRLAASLNDVTATIGQFLPGAASDALVGASFYSIASVGAAESLDWWQGGLVLLAIGVRRDAHRRRHHLAEGRDVAVDLGGAAGAAAPRAGAAVAVRRVARPRWCGGSSRCRRRSSCPRSGGSRRGCRIERRPDAASVAAALDAGEILRTHVLRPTWHFLHPDDARWVHGALGRARAPRERRRTTAARASRARPRPARIDVVADLARGRAPHPRRARRRRSRPGAAEGRAQLHLRHDARRARAHRDQRGERREAAHLRRVRRAGAAVAAEAARRGARRARRPVHRRRADRPPSATSRRGRASRSATRGRRSPTPADPRRAGALESVDVDGAPHGSTRHPSPSASRPAPARTPRARRRRRPAAGVRRVHHGLRARPARTCCPPGARIPCAPSSPLHALVVDGVMAGRWAPVVEAKRARVRIVPWRTFSRGRGTLARGIRRRAWSGSSACRSPSKSSRPPRPDRAATADRYDRAMAVIASIFVALAALLHGYIFLMESVWWTRPSTWKRFGVADQAAADIDQADGLQPGLLQPVPRPRRGARARALLGGRDGRRQDARAVHHRVHGARRARAHDDRARLRAARRSSRARCRSSGSCCSLLS